MAICVAGAAVLLPGAATAAPVCLTPVAADGFEPPCNPFAAGAAWSGAHRGSYAQASSPFPAPAPGDAVRVDHTAGVFGVPLIWAFTEPYADGGRAAWASTVATPDGRYVYKVDVATGREISRYGVLEAAELPGTGGVSGAYSVLDRDNHLIVGRERAFDVYGDAVPGDRLSPVARLGRFTLPDSALCGPDDRLVGIALLWDGRIAFASALGVVGTVPREPARMTAANLVTVSINGDRCAGANADDDTLDQVSNSIAASEDGGIHVVTSKAMYRYDWDGARLARAWRAPYETGAESAVRIGTGSGSTPTLMGSGPRQDRFVVITDGRPLMHLVLFWRDAIPRDWKGLPGKDRRVACEVPVRFGDPNATTSQSEQSVLVRGYGSVVVNNQLKDDRAFAGLPGNARLVAAALAGGDPNNAPYGVERIDWDPKTRTCRTRWVNREVSIPNGIPVMSTATGLVYGSGQRNGTFGLEGLDFDTGISRLWVPAGASPDHNSAYSATTVGPDGAVWTGTLLGYDIFRGPARPAPPLACLDRTAPTARVQTVRLSRSRVVVTGRAADRACDAPATAPRVRVSLRRRSGGARLAFTARSANGRFRLRRAARLAPGRYVVTLQVADAAGNAPTRIRSVSARVR